MSVIKELEHLRRIPFRDIKVATKNFTTIIGQGGYGPVYKGELSLSGKLISVAIKRLLNVNDSGQGLKEFLTERQLLSRYKHPNLVSLLGYCEDGNERILIYEYADHGSFDRYLNPAKTKCPLTWRQRLNICVDAARGLDYLHNHVAANHRVIHRDIKSANILLHENQKAMIADLGLSKIGRANENVTYLITNAGGTLGYCDPAYINDGVLTKESDVYSFGVVLFEALCGRLFFMDVIGKRRLHVPLARRCYEEGKLNLIMDLDLKDTESVNLFSEIAYQCLHDDQKGRPSMDMVLEKLENALKLLEFEEACESQELEEALGLQKLVETLQVQEFVEALVLQELDEALELQELLETLELHKLGEILELQTNYALIKAINMMKNTPSTCATKEELYVHLSKGSLVDEGKVWFSVDKNGRNQEMISAMKFMHLNPNKCQLISIPESRFPMVANILNVSKANMQVKIKTQFLSSEVIYAVYLRCKHKYSDQDQVIRSLKYKINNQSQSYVSYPGDYEEGWTMIELFQTRSFKRDVEFKILLEGFDLAMSKRIHEVIVEGIMFLPIQKFDNEKMKIQEEDTSAQCEIEWEKRLPSDYERFILYKGKKWVKKRRNCIITETKEEAYSILTKGIHIMVEDDINVIFWITKSNGKKCFMLSPESIQRGFKFGKFPIYHVSQSRFGNALHIPRTDNIFMPLKIRNPLLSNKTAYACYLVYKISEPLKNPLYVRITQRMTKSPHNERNSGNNLKRHYDQEKFVYLSTPQSPVIGPYGEERSLTTMNKPKTIEFPKERTDCWWEVKLGEFITHNDPRSVHNFQPWMCTCMCAPSSLGVASTEPDDEATTTLASLCLDYNPTIYIHMYYSRTQYKRIQIPSFKVQGIEFRPL